MHDPEGILARIYSWTQKNELSRAPTPRRPGAAWRRPPLAYSRAWRPDFPQKTHLAAGAPTAFTTRTNHTACPSFRSAPRSRPLSALHITGVRSIDQSAVYAPRGVACPHCRVYIFSHCRRPIRVVTILGHVFQTCAVRMSRQRTVRITAPRPVATRLVTRPAKSAAFPHEIPCRLSRRSGHGTSTAPADPAAKAVGYTSRRGCSWPWPSSGSKRVGTGSAWRPRFPGRFR